ncbi:MAG: alpha/beta hydrolase [Lachnospiraceae bacterium]|nr:alpha/beta hydrolase [Lachnospiraceae bacterium]
MSIAEKRNANLMNLIKRMHGVVENTDIEKHRQSQKYFGALLGSSKDVLIEDVDIHDHAKTGDMLQGEWVYVNRAHMKKYVILYCHGGGYSTGSRLYARTLTGKLAMSTSMDVLSFDYRLAPEHPYPAALEDAMKVWDYLMLLGYGARDVILAGDSAGGNLALALTLKLRKEKRLLPRGLVLMSPWTDLTSSGQSHKTKAQIDPVLNAAYLAEMIHNYAAQEDLTNPLISPLFGEYEGFPPTYIQVGENEVLQDDAKMLYQKLLKANVSVRLDIFPGMWHVFQMSPFKTAYEAMDRNAEFIYDICR